MKLYARLVKQNGTELFQTALSPEELVSEEHFRVDRWSPDGGTGYQRELNLNHIRNIARYLQGEEDTNVLPTTIILNSRTPFKKTDKGNGFYEIEIDRWPLYITDGQHRIDSFKININNGQDFSNYFVPVTITNFTLEEEIAHFRKINTTQNRASVGLNQQLRSVLANQYGMDLTPEERAEDRAVKIITRLATDPESPWYDRIQLGGRRRTLQQTAAQGTFVRAIRRMFQSGRFNNPEEDMNQVYQVFFDFWSAVADCFPEAFATPTKYDIQGPAGLHAWCAVMERLLSLNLRPSRSQMVQAIESMKDRVHMDDSYWEKSRGKARQTMRQFGHKQAYSLLSDELWYNLPKQELKEVAGI